MKTRICVVVMSLSRMNLFCNGIYFPESVWVCSSLHRVYLSNNSVHFCIDSLCLSCCTFSPSVFVSLSTDVLQSSSNDTNLYGACMRTL